MTDTAVGTVWDSAVACSLLVLRKTRLKEIGRGYMNNGVEIDNRRSGPKRIHQKNFALTWPDPLFSSLLFFTPFPFLFRSVPPAASQSQSHSQAAYIVLEHRRWCSDAFLGYISGKRGDCLKADRMWELRFTPTRRSHFNFNLVVTFRISRRMNNKALFLTSSLIGTRFTHMFSWQWIYFIFVEKNSFINFTYWKH